MLTIFLNKDNSTTCFRFLQLFFIHIVELSCQSLEELYHDAV
nr:MAG TPA: hypothetical protein [Caudoviricetes sp.]